MPSNADLRKSQSITSRNHRATTPVKRDPLFDASQRSAWINDKQLRSRARQVKWTKVSNIWHNTLVLVNPRSWPKISILFLLVGAAGGFWLPKINDLMVAPVQPIVKLQAPSPIPAPLPTQVPPTPPALAPELQQEAPPLKLSFTLSQPSN